MRELKIIRRIRAAFRRWSDVINCGALLGPDAGVRSLKTVSEHWLTAQCA